MSHSTASVSTFRDIDIFLHQLTQICRDELVSVILHAPTANQPFTWASGAHNLVIVLQDARLELLQELRPLLQRWWRSHRLSVQCLGYWELQDAAPALGLPLIRMRTAYRCLWGEDVLQEIVIPWEHLRLQIEQHTREVLLWFRQTYLRDSSDTHSFQAFLYQASQKIQVLVADAKLLYPSTYAPSYEDINRLNALYHLSPECLWTLHNLSQATPEAMETLAIALEDELAALAGRLNHLPTPSDEGRLVA